MLNYICYFEGMNVLCFIRKSSYSMVSSDKFYIKKYFYCSIKLRYDLIDLNDLTFNHLKYHHTHEIL